VRYLIAFETRVLPSIRTMSPGRNAQEGSWIGGRQRYKALYWLSQLAREPAAQPLRDPISETRIRSISSPKSSKSSKLRLGGRDYGFDQQPEWRNQGLSAG
jgi:hypothetical protein